MTGLALMVGGFCRWVLFAADCAHWRCMCPLINGGDVIRSLPRFRWVVIGNAVHTLLFFSVALPFFYSLCLSSLSLPCLSSPSPSPSPRPRPGLHPGLLEFDRCAVVLFSTVGADVPLLRIQYSAFRIPYSVFEKRFPLHKWAALTCCVRRYGACQRQTGWISVHVLCGA
jgi:hypothetical protein